MEFEKPKKPLLRRLPLLVTLAVVVLLLAVSAFDAFYTVGEQENAVVTTFGVPQTGQTVPWVLLLAAGLSGAAAIAVTRRKNRKGMRAC